MGMRKKLDALRGRRTFKPDKFKALVNVAISRLAVLKKQRQTRCSQARSDVIQFLNLSHQDRALLRVEQVIKEQNMLDVYVMIEGYCLLLIERVDLIEQERACPDELKEAISGLLYASSRCGEFPELQEIRAVITSRFGKEFAAHAVELRSNCGVNLKIIQKLSTRQPSLESRLKVLKEIASENGIVLQLEEDSSVTAEEKLDINQKQNLPEPEPSVDSGGAKLRDDENTFPEELEKDDGFSGSMKVRKYRDVADAAQAAFKSAAYAAAAARAAVELSRSDPHDPDYPNSPNPRRRNEVDSDEPMITTVHPIQNYHSESEDEEIYNENPAEESKQIKNEVELKRSMSVSSSDSAGDIKATTMSSDVQGQTKPSGKEIVFDDSDEETGNEETRIPWLKTHYLGFDTKPSLLTNEVLGTEKSNSVKDEDLSEGSGVKLHYPSHKQIPLRPQAGLKIDSRPGNHMAHSAEGSGMKSAQHLNIEKRPISVRTRQLRGY